MIHLCLDLCALLWAGCFCRRVTSFRTADLCSERWGGRPIDEAEYWAVKTDDADFRRTVPPHRPDCTYKLGPQASARNFRKCLDCRKHLVLFHGRRGELHERVDLAAFKERLRRCEERATELQGAPQLQIQAFRKVHRDWTCASSGDV